MYELWVFSIFHIYDYVFNSRSGYQTKRNVLESEKNKGDDPFSPYSSNYIGELQYNKNSPSYVTPSPGSSLAQLLPSINLKSSTVSSGATPKPFKPFSSVISKFKSGFSTPKPNSFSSQKYSDQNGNFNLNLNGNKVKDLLRRQI